MRFARLAAVVLIFGPLSGCMKKDMERLENQIQLLDKRVELLQQDQEKANTQILEGWKRLRGQMESEIGSVQRSSAEGATRIDELIREMRNLSDRIEKTGFQYQRLSEQLALVQDRLRGAVPAAGMDPAGAGMEPMAGGSTGAGGAPGSQRPAADPRAMEFPAAGADSAEPGMDPRLPAGGTNEGAGDFGADTAGGDSSTFEAGLDPDLTYKAAYSDYAQGNFKLAIVNFEAYVRQFPTSAKAVLAQYFIGESYYALGQYREAVAAFDKVVTTWPGDEKVPVAYLKKGYALLAMGQKALGMAVLQELMTRHPNTHEALLAKERLEAL